MNTFQGMGKSAMNSDNFFDDDRTLYKNFDAGPEEEKLSFFIENDPGNKIFLNSGISVSIGRSPESDFFIENKTVSRNHLKVIRDKEQVKIEILGRNGLYIDEQHHARSFITIRPPAVFRIGDVSCCLELELDEDRTIIVTSPYREKMPFTPSEPQPSHPTPTTPDPVPKPFDPSPIDSFIPSTASDKQGAVHLQEQAMSVPDTSDPIITAPLSPPRPVDSGVFEASHDPRQAEIVQPPPSPQSNFDPIPQKKQNAHNQRNGQSPGNSGRKNKLLIAGFVTMAAALLALTGFIFFSGKSDKKVAESNVPKQTTTKERGDATSLAPGSNKADPNQALIRAAEKLINSGDYVTAEDILKDILKDIPKDSASYADALKLMEKLSEK